MKKWLWAALVLVVCVGMGWIGIVHSEDAEEASGGDSLVMTVMVLTVDVEEEETTIAVLNQEEEDFVIVNAGCTVSDSRTGPITVDKLESGNWVDISYTVRDDLKVASNVVRIEDQLEV